MNDPFQTRRAWELLDGLAAGEKDLRTLPATLVVLAHADDETVAFGARLSRFFQATFVYVTDGAPQDGADAAENGVTVESYRFARRRELLEVFTLAEIPSTAIRDFSIPDQEAAFDLIAVTQRIVTLVKCLQPEIILTHPYEGGHPDHDACAFACSAAVKLTSSDRRPLLCEAACYHAGPKGIESHCFPGGSSQPKSPFPVRVVPLSASEQTKKEQRLRCFSTQQKTLQYLQTGMEQFRAAPAYNFMVPPHEGALWYERYGWAIDGQRFRTLAEKASTELGLNFSREPIFQCL